MSKRFKGETMTKPKTMISMFLETPVGDHLPRNTTGDAAIEKVGPVMVVHRDETLPRVFRKLTVEGFLSAPVMEGSRYVGFIDMMDLVNKTKQLFTHDTEEGWVDFWEKEARFQDTTVDDILAPTGLFDREPVPPIPSDFTSFAALEMLVRGKQHRLAVVRPGTTKLETIITQSMFISWIRQHKSLLGSLRTVLVSDIVDELKDDCVCVHQDKKTINAFNTMASKKISGVAVVDDEGLLVTGISIRDLRTVGTSGEFFHRLYRSIKEFKKLAREEHSILAPRTHYSKKQVPRKGLCVALDDTFENVLDKMYDGNIHRVFVVEDTSRPKPLKVISQVDMLRMVMDHIIKEAQFCEKP